MARLILCYVLDFARRWMILLLVRPNERERGKYALGSQKEMEKNETSFDVRFTEGSGIEIGGFDSFRKY